jgi:hypothetical protein
MSATAMTAVTCRQAVLRARVEGLNAGDGSGLAPAAGALMQWSEKRQNKALHHLSGAWTTFQGTSPFWS